jgi:hypothetical protein
VRRDNKGGAWGDALVHFGVNMITCITYAIVVLVCVALFASGEEGEAAEAAHGAAAGGVASMLVCRLVSSCVSLLLSSLTSSEARTLVIIPCQSAPSRRKVDQFVGPVSVFGPRSAPGRP